MKPFFSVLKISVKKDKIYSELLLKWGSVTGSFLIIWEIKSSYYREQLSICGGKIWFKIHIFADITILKHQRFL